jgi:hypothetical protein
MYDALTSQTSVEGIHHSSRTWLFLFKPNYERASTSNVQYTATYCDMLYKVEREQYNKNRSVEAILTVEDSFHNRFWINILPKRQW